jgi:DNA-binding NtrC family response regulator
MPETRVLIVDDEEEFANTLAERMRNRGLVAEAVNSGEDAIESASRGLFDVAVLDLAMPGMDGIETLKQLLSIRPDLQVILLTGHGTVGKSVEALKSGAFEFLEKPIKFDELLKRIGEAKSKKSALSEEKMDEMIKDILRRYGV